MNGWKFCVTSLHDAALALCGGSMDEGSGCGDGYSGESDGNGNGYGRGHGGDGFGYSYGWVVLYGEEGDGWSPKEWR